MNSKNICIFYFSGTGNTKIITNLLAEEFEKYGMNVDVVAIEDVLNCVIPLKLNYEIYGFGHPVHAFSAPKIFFKFIANLPNIEKSPSFYFKTAGDPFFNGGDNSRIRKKLWVKGYKVFHETLFVMPANVLIQYEDDLVKQLYLTAQRKIKKVVREVLENRTSLQDNNSIICLFSYLFSKAESYGSSYFGKFLYVTNKCNQCKLCLNNCPTRNIYSENDKIKFGNRCTLCLRCVYLCPVKSIKNKFMNFLILKQGYKINKAIKNPALKGKFVTEKTRGYFKHFYKYFKAD